MTDRPILYSAAMVNALLEGRKPQTRRILKPQPDPHLPIGGADKPYDNDERWAWLDGRDGSLIQAFKSPYAVGDRLWVRENHWALGHWITTDELTQTGKPKRKFIRAPDTGVSFEEPSSVLPNRFDSNQHMRKRIGRFMFKEDSRLTLTVTDVKIERVQDISEADAIAEGIELDLETGAWWGAIGQGAGGATRRYATPTMAFHDLWNSINGPDAWARNDWVIVPSFTVAKVNINDMEPT